MLNKLIQTAMEEGLDVTMADTIKCPLCGEQTALHFKYGRAHLYACVCGYRRSTPTWTKSRLDEDLTLTLQKVLTQNAIRMISNNNQYPEEIAHAGANFIYGTMHDGAAVYYRETWLRSHIF